MLAEPSLNQAHIIIGAMARRASCCSTGDTPTAGCPWATTFSGRHICRAIAAVAEKSDQTWIEQKNGAVVRKAVGDHRYDSIGAARLVRLYAAPAVGSVGEDA